MGLWIRLCLQLTLKALEASLRLWHGVFSHGGVCGGDMKVHIRVHHGTLFGPACGIPLNEPRIWLYAAYTAGGILCILVSPKAPSVGAA